MLLRYEDQYEMSNQLVGQGAFAQVFLATRKKDKLKVAVKVSNRNLPISQKEKNILLQLKNQTLHQNVIQILDIFDQNNVLFIVQEYCTGGTLYEMMMNRRFKEDEIVGIISQVGYGLQFLHQRNIVHRDIKPENILRQLDGCNEIFKITDFGLSSIKQERMTTTKVGTAYYVAPEILAGDGYDKLVDVWALGLIMDELIHGTPFYNGQSEEEVFSKIRNDNYFIRDQVIAKANVFDRKQLCLKTVLLSTIQRDPKNRKHLDWIIQQLAEYFIDSPMQEQKFQQSDRYTYNDISLFSQAIGETTQPFQQPMDLDNRYCGYHHMPIQFRMPGLNENTYGCSKCIQCFGVIDIREYQPYILQAQQQLTAFDLLFNQNQIIMESLRMLDDLKIYKEKEELIADLRKHVTKQLKSYKMEYQHYLDDLRSNNNAPWIDESLRLPQQLNKDMNNKLTMYIEYRMNEYREQCIRECQQIIKQSLKILLQEILDKLQHP